MPSVQLIQLPLHPGTAWEPTGNIPLAPAELAAAAGLPPDSVFPGVMADSLGDRALLEELQRRNPDIIAVTLYLWNRERTINLIRKFKELKPEVLAVAGGPEVTADNRMLLSEGSIDLFVAGEGETHAGKVLNMDSLRELISAGVRLLGPVVDTSPPDRWPDPYENGYLIPLAGGSAHVETQRGCGCLCSYCAYRRTSPVPRVMSSEKAVRKIGKLMELGASELVFLDPTFNARNDLDHLLREMAAMKLDCFAEVRGELLKPSDAEGMKAAGFNSLETGLQTMNSQVLGRVGRGGSPEKILQGAEYLRDSGITPVIDLILGLPGDDPLNIEKAAEELARRNISEQVQTFCLSVLPGTALRAEAAELGIQYSSRAPYCVTQSGQFSLEDLMRSRDRVSDILGYDADPPPRPALCDGFPGAEIFTPESPSKLESSSLRHGVLRIVTDNPWEFRESIVSRAAMRRKADPFCPVDVVIDSRREFPLDLLEMISELPEPECYDAEKARIYGVPSLIRVAVISQRNADRSWLEECSRLAVTVVRSKQASALPGGEIGLLLEGSYDLPTLSALYSQAPHLVFFRDFDLERLWNLDVLGLG